MELISVIIPVYNIEKYISRCLESLINQTYKNLEIIVMNDGSTDNSLEIINEYSKKDNRIIVVNKKNTGVSNTRNMAIDISKGTYITFVDGDDWIDTNAIENLYTVAIKKDADIVKCNYVKEWDHKQEEVNVQWNNEYVDKTEIYKKFILTYELNSMWGQLIRTSLIKKNNIKIDENFIYGEDALFNYELYTYAQNVVLLNNPYYHYYYSNPNSITQNRTIEKIRNKAGNAVKAYKKLNEFIEIWDMPEMKKVVENRVWQEFIYRTKEFFMLNIEPKILEKEIKEIAKKIEPTEKIYMTDKENKMYASLISKGNIEGYVKRGIFIRNRKERMKKLIKNSKIRLLIIYKRIKYRKLFRQFEKLNILDDVRTLNKIIKERLSIARFGDGEFNIILNNSIHFQKQSRDLSNRLKEVLQSKNNNCVIGIPIKFKKLNHDKLDSKRFWINYTTENGEKLLKYLDNGIQYGSANFTRFYIDYKNNKYPKRVLNKLRKVWENRNIVMIEGETTRLGVGNDLFSNAKSISRIICPSKNAFESYRKIIEKAKTIDKDALIIIALGPTATVLAYDLSNLGYQALDMGHIDVEYEWYTRNAKEKIAIKGKDVSEVSNNKNEMCEDEEYKKSIIAKVD